MSEQATPGSVRTPLEERRHPLHLFAGRLTATLDDLGEVPPLSLGPDETAEAVVELTTALSRLRAVQLALLAHADRIDLGATVDATSTAAWLRSRIP